MAENSEKKLNKEQLKAVKHVGSPLLIIAGAGTGKTTVITEKIKHLIAEKIVKPSEILALTFTEKAAREMEQRVDVALPLGYTQMWISTFHSFCDQLLRNEALNIGLNPSFKLMTQTETIQFVRNHLYEFDLDYFRPHGNPTKFVDGMIRHFSRLQDEDVTPQEYLEWTTKQKNLKTESQEERLEIKKWRELASAYKKYQELKRNEGRMDFGDLIGETLNLFRTRENVLEKYKKQFKFILVDEFQDTNVAQYELIKLISANEIKPKSKRGEGSNLTVVGDDSQSIYAFRGAAISNILKFKDEFKNAETVVLTKNYRSSQSILDDAYRLIQFNNPDTLEAKLGIDKNLKSKNGRRGDEIKFIHVDRVENEAEAVAKEVKRLCDEKEYEFKDFAILVRANNHADPFMRAFTRHSLPYQFLGPGKLFRQQEVIDLIAYLKVLYDQTDSGSLYKLIASDFFDFSQKDVIVIMNSAKKQNTTLFKVFEEIADGKTSIQIGDKTKTDITKLIGIIRRQVELTKKESAGQILYNFLEESELIPRILNPENILAEKRAKNIAKLFDKLKTYETDHDDASIFAVVDWIDLASELGESPLATDSDWTEINAVNILTVHSAKGLEFPVVFMVNLVGQRFPTNQRRDQIPIPEDIIKDYLPEGDYHVQEERRLFYVGMTRAKDMLYFAAANYYGEGKREKKLSPFIFEALGDAAAGSELLNSGNQLSILDYQKESNEVVKTSHKLDPVHVDFLSYSQIQTFQICPLHYKLKYIYKVPTPPTSSQSFGNSFHNTMKEIYESATRGEKVTRRSVQEILARNWINEGYLNKSHERGSFNKALGFLNKYVKNSFDPKKIPVAMEQPFTVRIDNLRVGGKIDRIDVEGNTIHIIDYKTGSSVPSQKDVDNDLQLSIYALAATSIPEFPYDRKPEEVKLSLMYFDPLQLITTTRTKEQLEDAKKQILEVKNEIEQSDFVCSNHILCQRGCEYKLFCGVEK